VKKVVEPDWSGYSYLAAGGDGTVYLLFERGLRTRALTLARFNLEWLTDGKDVGKK
jgi:sialidase-1